MRLNAPKQITWLVAVVFGVVGLVAYFVTIPGLSANAFWLVMEGGCTQRGTVLNRQLTGSVDSQERVAGLLAAGR
jgi:hypothetical protein